MAVYINDPSKYYQPPPASTPAPGDERPGSGTYNLQQADRPARSPSRSLDRSGFEPGECTRLMFKGSSPPKSAKHGSNSPPHDAPLSRPWIGTITYPLYTRPNSSESSQELKHLPPRRTFAILRTHPGMNPWNVGPYRNWKSVMGNKWFDWFLPLRLSPCCNHDRDDTLYDLGPDMERLKQDAGITERLPSRGSTTLASTDARGRRRRHRRHRHRSSEGESLHSMASSTLANVDGSTGRDAAERS